MAERRLKRPRDPLELAKLIGDIATGRLPDAADDGKNADAIERGRKGGKKGGVGRANALTQAQRSEIARTAAQARWKKQR